MNWTPETIQIIEVAVGCIAVVFVVMLTAQWVGSIMAKIFDVD